MRAVVLDAMELRANGVRRELERGGKILANAGEALHHAQAIEREPGHAHGEAKLRPQACPGIARNGDVVHFRQLRAGSIEAKSESREREGRRRT